jgi:hypothetical protein
MISLSVPEANYTKIPFLTVVAIKEVQVLAELQRSCKLID